MTDEQNEQSTLAGNVTERANVSIASIISKPHLAFVLGSLAVAMVTVGVGTYNIFTGTEPSSTIAAVGIASGVAALIGLKQAERVWKRETGHSRG